MNPFARSAVVAVMAAIATVPVSAQWHSVMSNREPMVTGSGRIVTQQRPIGTFQRVELRGATDAEVRVGGAPSLAIRADDNILPLLTSRIENGTLILDTRGSFRTRTATRAFITIPSLTYLKTAGSGDARIDNVAGRTLELLIQGSGNVHATGRTGAVKLTVQGSGNGDLRGLAAGRADVAVMGSGNAWVATRGAVDARSFGSGNVYVLGRPSQLHTQKAGSGRVIVSSR